MCVCVRVCVGGGGLTQGGTFWLGWDLAWSGTPNTLSLGPQGLGYVTTISWNRNAIKVSWKRSLRSPSGSGPRVHFEFHDSVSTQKNRFLDIFDSLTWTHSKKVVFWFPSQFWGYRNFLKKFAELLYSILVSCEPFFGRSWNFRQVALRNGGNQYYSLFLSLTIFCLDLHISLNLLKSQEKSEQNSRTANATDMWIG